MKADQARTIGGIALNVPDCSTMDTQLMVLVLRMELMTQGAVGILL